MARGLILAFVAACVAWTIDRDPLPGPAEAVATVLDDLHDAASKADGERYFGLFAPNAVFLGTDATERWTLAMFREYASRRFEQGSGWTYHVRQRRVSVSGDGNTAWFDESLHNEKYGTCRGTGVLVRRKGAWKVAQYNLTIPIPNEIALDVVRMIREATEG
ncbi:MAG: nuclear transport factor 2 family protein [Planctomycetota bacterium]|jgi:hypothetical protein